jgi:CheY-like chemotaxis protein
MAGRGTLTIATRNDGDDAILEVSDDGSGMNDETRARLFEPFFTTKDVGDGTGLGLSTVYGIVTQSGGMIEVRSAPGQGATFTVRLPATKLVEATPTPAQPAVEGGAERILVVDDEKVVRELLARMLREQGYDVAVAGSAREARGLGERWDLLVTDIVMPDTDGVQLSKEIDARHVLFISGYDQEALVASDASFLQKPFSRDELTRAVRALLDGARIAAGSFAA